MTENTSANVAAEAETRPSEPARIVVHLGLNGWPEVRNPDTGTYERAMHNKGLPIMQVAVNIGDKETLLMEEIKLGRFLEFVAVEVQDGKGESNVEFFYPSPTR